jgi:Protein of unknown function (DUF3579)
MNAQVECVDPPMATGSEYIVIKGVTREGRRFRPSDWAERLATAVGQMGPDRRIRFHPQVRIATVDDEKCVLVDLALEENDPMLFSFLMHFAQDNHLQTAPDLSFDKDGKPQVHIEHS